ncbi:MAG: ribonuclease BN [Gammaproteobacteria bacterium]|nr:MAG: ribonuclease BN [Gammaproteobacteria bacterium]
MIELITKIRNFFSVTLWQDLPEQTSTAWRWLINSLRVTYIMIRELVGGELNLRAMSLVFTSLLSLVPLIAVAFSVLKAFGVHNQIEPALLGMLAPLGPQGVEITDNIIGFVENVKVGVLGSLGLAILFYTIIALIQKIENAFNYVWRVKQARTLARRFTDYLSVVMIGPVLVFTALGITATVMTHSVVQNLQAIEPFGTLILLLSKLLPYVMIIIAFTFLYTFIPNTRVKLMPALVGATVAGILWITVGKVFAIFVATSANYTAIYSSFAILFFFMIWLYLGWLILLTGSQVAFYLQHPKLVQLEDRQYILSPRLREKEGLWLMMVIARQFHQQQPALNVQQLEVETELTSDSVEELLTMMVNAGLLVELIGDEISYVPSQDIAEIKIHTILDSLRCAEEVELIPIKTTTEPVIEQILQRLDDAQKEVLSDLSLRDLVMDKFENE